MPLALVLLSGKHRGSKPIGSQDVRGAGFEIEASTIGLFSFIINLPMDTITAKEIEKLKHKIAVLEAKAIKADAKRKKTALHKIMAIVAKYGFATLAELTADAKNIVSKRADAPRKRAKITETIRKAILADIKKGVDSALVIAKRHGVSQPSVNNIKKAAGLTKSRKAKPAKTVAEKQSPKKVSKPKKAPKSPAPAAPLERPSAV